MKINLILLDMDEVLVDFEGGVCKLFDVDRSLVSPRKQWDICPSLGITNEQMWERIHEIGEDFWLELEELPWFDGVVNLCSEQVDRVVIVSSPSSEPSSHVGKIEWLKRRFGYSFKDFVLFGEKEILATSNRILIDDRTETCGEFINAGGRAIIFPQNGNELFRYRGDMKYFSYVLKRFCEE